MKSKTVDESRAVVVSRADSSPLPVPVIIAEAGDRASEHFLEFFAAQIRNRNTRVAYVQAVAQFFAWCETRQLQLPTIRPLHVAAYIESKQREMSAPSISSTWPRCGPCLIGWSSNRSFLRALLSSSRDRNSAERRE